MHDQADISVLIPAYNRALTLPRAINSALNQTFRPLEVLVIDDGSTDNTEQLICAYENAPLRYLRTENKQGAAAARNRGIAEARGKWIAFLDSDDYWRPHKLERQIQALEQSDSSRLVCFHQVVIADGVVQEARPFRGPLPDEKVGDYLFRHGGLMQTSSLLGRREVFEKVRFDPDLARHQDWDLCLQLEKAGFGFLFIPEALAVWSCVPAVDKISNLRNATASRQWLENRAPLLSSAAQQAFVAEVIAPELYRSGHRREACAEILKGGSSGALSTKSVFRLLLNLCLPRWLYDLLRKVPFYLRSNKS